MRRFTIITVLPLSTLFVTACTTSPSAPIPVPTPPAQGLLTYNREEISFRYPATWTAYRYTAESSFSTLIVYLSNDTLHPPCHEGYCGEPIEHIGPNGVLVTWTERGSPGWSFQQTGTPLTLGGHRATMQIQHPGLCSAIGGGESVSVVVERPALRDNYWRIDACIRGPSVATAEGQVRAMLDTAQFPSD